MSIVNSQWLPRARGRECCIGRTQSNSRAMKVFYMTLSRVVDTFHQFSKPTEHTPPKAKHNVKSGLWMMMMYQCEFIHCNNCTTTQVWDVDSRGSYACAGTGGFMETLYFQLKFAVNQKLLKKSSILKKQITEETLSLLLNYLEFCILYMHRVV